MNTEQLFKDRLRSAGERITTPRVGIFRVFTRLSPLSMSKLISTAQQDGIDSVTTYRTVELFRKLGLIQEIGLGRNRLFELSETFHAHHHHFTCLQCGRIFDFDNEAIEEGLKQASDRLGFTVRSHQLEATGICVECSRETTQ